MDSQVLRLWYKGKIVGYIMIRYGNIFLYKELEYSHESVENWFDEQVYFDSFDPSLKQGDEWFFDGDEVNIRHRESALQLTGELIYENYTWGVLNEKTGKVWRIQFGLDTLTLIKRAV